MFTLKDYSGQADRKIHSIKLFDIISDTQLGLMGFQPVIAPSNFNTTKSTLTNGEVMLLAVISREMCQCCHFFLGRGI